MAQRGRKGVAALTVVSPDGITSVPRPEPPEALTDEQQGEWWAVVNRMPADWFPRETQGLLIQYCRHVVQARRVAQLIAKLESGKKFDLGEYDKLLKMQEREGRAISSLATKMRLSQQSLYSDKQGKGSRGAAKKPWEFGNGD